VTTKLTALDPTAYCLERDTDLQGDLFDVQHERKTWRRFGHEVTSIVFASLSLDIAFVAPKDFLLRGCALGLIARLANPVRPGVGQQWVEGGSYGLPSCANQTVTIFSWAAVSSLKLLYGSAFQLAKMRPKILFMWGIPDRKHARKRFVLDIVGPLD
jgi:hypothetical protein